MILQVKWMLRRPLKKKKPAHCESTVEEPDLEESILASVMQKDLDAPLQLFYLSLTKDVSFSQPLSGLYGGRRKLSIGIDPGVPTDEDCEWRRAQHHCGRAAAGLHDHRTVSSSRDVFPSMLFQAAFILVLTSNLFFLPLLAAHKALIAGDPAVCHLASRIP